MRLTKMKEPTMEQALSSMENVNEAAQGITEAAVEARTWLELHHVDLVPLFEEYICETAPSSQELYIQDDDISAETMLERYRMWLSEWPLPGELPGD